MIKVLVFSKKCCLIVDHSSETLKLIADKQLLYEKRARYRAVYVENYAGSLHFPFLPCSRYDEELVEVDS